MSPILQEIKTILEVARSNVARQVNNELLNTCWNIDSIICENEQSDYEQAKNNKAYARGCRSVQYVSKLLCKQSERQG